MQKTLDIKLTADEAAEIVSAIDKCDAALVEIFRESKKDQAEIERLKIETRQILGRLKAMNHVAKAA